MPFSGIMFRTVATEPFYSYIPWTIGEGQNQEDKAHFDNANVQSASPEVGFLGTEARSFSSAALSADLKPSIFRRVVVVSSLVGIGSSVVYTFFSRQPESARLHLTKLPAEQHPHDIGTFNLTDDRGKPYTEKQVKNEFAVLLFGALDHPDLHAWLDRFAHCLWRSDDLCNQEHLHPIVICLDAEKDTPERCKDTRDALRSHRIHKELFHRRVRFVTGEDATGLHEAAHHFTRKFFGKDPQHTGTPRSTDLGDIYMISPEGKFLESYTLEADPELIARDWARVQKEWNIHHPSWHGCRNVAKRYA